MKAETVATELADAAELLAGTTMGHLAYVAADGTPRALPVGFYWTGEEFVVSTATTAPKVTAIGQRPDVALTVDAGGTPGSAKSLSVRGRADITIVDGVVPEYLAASRQSMDAESAAEFEKNVRKVYPQMARIAITPTWVRYYDFGSGRVPKFLGDLIEANPY